MINNWLANAGDTRDWVPFLGQEDPLEEGRATHSSILAWRFPWTEEPGRVQVMGLQRVRHNCETHTHTHTQSVKNKIMPFATTRMDLEIIILSEVSQKEKNKYNTVSLICGI